MKLPFVNTLPRRLIDAFQQGRRDYRKQKGMGNVPYRELDRAEAWERGWNYEQKEKHDGKSAK